MNVMEMGPLEAANEAWMRHRAPGDDAAAIEDCVRLASYGVFSNRHLWQITGLGEKRVAALTEKSDKTGGRLAMESLPLLIHLQADWANGVRNTRLLRAIIAQGTSRGMVSKLTGIPPKTVDRMSA